MTSIACLPCANASVLVPFALAFGATAIVALMNWIFRLSKERD
jgi:hypothetical protein